MKYPANKTSRAAAKPVPTTNSATAGSPASRAPAPSPPSSTTAFHTAAEIISVTVLDWSATTTFLLQAEAVRRSVSEAVRKSYPVIFNHTMNFPLPESARGTCIEADVEGTPIVLPIGRGLSLSWADCETETEAENTKLYRCELKPGYVFR